MLATLICNDCGEGYVITNRSIVFPFVCDKCQAETKKFQEDIAPANANLAKLMTEPSVLEPCVDASLLISDLAQQLNETTVERNDLRERNEWQVGEINVLVDRVIAKDTQIANQAGTIKRLEAQNELTTSYAVQLAKELVYAANRIFTLAIEKAKLTRELKLVTEERESAYASELALHNKLAKYIEALNEQKKETTVAGERFLREYRGKIDQWRQKRDLQDRLEHPWKNLWKFYQDKVR